jgi:hypothetical protein
VRTISLPARSREFGVGKEMVGSVYVHRNYEAVFGDRLTIARNHLPPGFDYTIVKYNRNTGSFSFIHSPDFDTESEPTVGNIWTIKADGSATYRKQLADPYIYHHKWLMVADDYAGFSVEASKARSRSWMSIEGLDMRRIGRRGYWERLTIDSRIEGAISSLLATLS